MKPPKVPLKMGVAIVSHRKHCKASCIAKPPQYLKSCATNLKRGPALQLTDQVAKVLLPECKSVDELKAAVMDAERNAAQAQSMAALQNEICAKIAELVDTEIPEFLYRTVGESQYQAELLQGQSEVSD